MFLVTWNFGYFSKSFHRALLVSALLMQCLQYRECNTIKKALYSEKWSNKPHQENSTVSQIPSSVLSGIEDHNNTSNYTGNRQNSKNTNNIPKMINNKSNHRKGFLESALNYLQDSKMIQSYAVKIKNDLSTFVETEREKLFSGRQFQTATIKPGWMESAMVPMAFITFAMFLMDIMQRMYPYYGGGSYGWSKGADYYDYYNRVQAPSATTDSSTSIKISSLFGRSSDYSPNKNSKSSKKQQRPSVNKYANARRPTQNTSQKNGVMNLAQQNKRNNRNDASNPLTGPDKGSTRMDIPLPTQRPFYYFL